MRGNTWAVALAAVTLGLSGAGCKKLFEGPDLPDIDAGPLGGGVGDPCSAGMACRTGLECQAAICQVPRTGTAGSKCDLTAQCVDGFYCGPTRACTAAGMGADGASCQSTGDCTAGLVCRVEGFAARCRAAGSADLGEACVREDECLAGLACAEQRCASLPPGPGGVPIPPIPPYWEGERCVDDTGTPRAYFEVPRFTGADNDFYRLPFPNDVRRTDTGIDFRNHPSPATVLPIDVIGRYLRASEEDLDGFSTNPAVFFRFSKPYDWDSVGGQLTFINITPGSPDYGQALGLGWAVTSGPFSRYICPDFVVVRPPLGAPLRPGETYAVLMGSGLRPAGGGTFARDADFNAMLDKTAPADASLGRAWNAYAPLRTFLDATSRNPADLLNAAVFTTQDTEALMPRLRDVIRRDGIPKLSSITACGTGVRSPCDDGTGERTCSDDSPDFLEVHGKIELPIFQQGTAPYENPEDGGGVGVDGSGNPRIVRREPICFALTLPKAGAAPEAGYPLMLVAHGTGGSFTGAVRNGLAADVARGASAATLSIDMPQHGSRRGASTREPEYLFYNFANPRAARDNVLQGSADLLALVRFGAQYAGPSGELTPSRTIRFNPARIALFAHSQGSTHASLMVPFETDLAAVVLSGNGGDLTRSLLNKTQPVNIAAVMPFALLEPNFSQLQENHPALAVFQAYFDSVDPVNFARRLHVAPREGDTGRHVFMTYGLGDNFSPEATMQAYSLAAGLPALPPVLREFGLAAATAPVTGNFTVGGAARTQVLRQYTPEGTDDGHFVSTRTAVGRADTVKFLTEALTGTTPSLGGT